MFEKSSGQKDRGGRTYKICRVDGMFSFELNILISGILV